MEKVWVIQSLLQDGRKGISLQAAFLLDGTDGLLDARDGHMHSRTDLCIGKLEGGMLPLEESLKAYERAIVLVRFATDTLENAKQRVRILQKAQDGTVSDAPFATLEDET